ncbi:MAG: DNA-binding protein [Deltaproteobacteria bacterium]|nr:DNA-binding protein [Deltaproteobacteria bacterium]MBW2246258.1 DNA-binding protein [Deltaproteobacteria bacterium]MBW2639818.1 DNA-binding protein [Deltaproteobacteria bacterium]MBW2679725.1 DNA-binding protein [Deltaproteobacteria bacterium]
MDKLNGFEFKPGRHFVGRLPHGKDLVTSIEDFCKASSIQMATFSVIGAVSSATLGAYDQKQQVYATFTQEEPLEIVNCTGNISLLDENPVIHAHIILGNLEGNTIGGHLFSETTIYAAEIDLQELTGTPLERAYDDTTGLMLWKISD